MPVTLPVPLFVVSILVLVTVAVVVPEGEMLATTDVGHVGPAP